LLAPADELFLRGRVAGFLDDPGLHRLATTGVRHAGDGHFENRRVLGQHLFYLARVDVEATGDDHILLAIFDVEVAVLVHPGDVAGVEPAIAQAVGRFRGHLPVAGHHAGAADDQLAGLAHRHDLVAIFRVDNPRLDVGQRQADPGPVLAINGVGVGHYVSFRQAIAFDQLGAGDG